MADVTSGRFKKRETETELEYLERAGWTPQELKERWNDIRSSRGTGSEPHEILFMLRYSKLLPPTDGKEVLEAAAKLFKNLKPVR